MHRPCALRQQVRHSRPQREGLPWRGGRAHCLGLVPDQGAAVKDLDAGAELLGASLASPGYDAVVRHALNVIAERIADLRCGCFLLPIVAPERSGAFRNRQHCMATSEQAEHAKQLRRSILQGWWRSQTVISRFSRRQEGSLWCPACSCHEPYNNSCSFPSPPDDDKCSVRSG